MSRRLFSTLVLLCYISPCLKAQFYSLGSDAGSLRWSSIETQTYKVIFPKGQDSLARNFARQLERCKIPVSDRLGYIPNCQYRKKMPVVLHTQSSYSNGVVTWTPHRMDLLAVPDAYRPEPHEWSEMLTVHESRHVAQMQYTRQGFFKVLHYITGELGDGAGAALYCGPAWFEGDAVAAETALTPAGRGRSADFLEYVRVCQDKGQYRDFWQWRYGSQRHYCPDHYRAGYMLSAGMRSVFDAPDFTERYYQRIFERGVPIGNLQGTVREVSGMKFRDAFRKVEDGFQDVWEANRKSRGETADGRLSVEVPDRYLSYYGSAAIDSGIYSIRSGIAEAASLVRLEADGKVRKICSFQSGGSRLASDGERLWWSEYRRDPRWELRSYSDIRYLTPDGRKHTLTRGGRLYNPAPCRLPSEKGASTVVAAVEFPSGGGSAVTLLDGNDGHLLARYAAPDSIQFTEPVWVDGTLYAAGISGEGFCIYKVKGCSPVLKLGRVKLHSLFSREGRIYFTSDRNGVNDLHAFDPASGTLTQITATRQGGTDFVFSGDSLYYSRPLPEGRLICSLPVSGLSERKPGPVWRDPIAEKLSAQREIPDTDGGNVEISEPERYSKAAHIFRFHSWLPFYFNYDVISAMSAESLSQAAGLGASAWFQNTLGTISGFVGYSAWNPSTGWRNSGHAKISWKAWYPVIEASVDVNDRDILEYTLEEGPKVVTAPIAAPSVKTSVKAWVPLTFSSGGWNRGIIPSAELALTNDRYRPKEGDSRLMSQYGFALRGYSYRNTPSSCIYPRWGIGAEGAFAGRLFTADVFSSFAYGKLYGYVPGFWKTHGVKLSAYVSRYLSSNQGLTTSFSADYAFPFAPVDWSGICPVAYVRNFEFTAHGDWGSDSSSVGGSLAAHLGNLLWLPFSTRIGVSYAYRFFGNTGSPHSVSLVFSVEM